MSAPICSQCSQTVAPVDRLSLSCGHSLHRSCARISSGGSIICPCQNACPPELPRRTSRGSDFDALTARLEEAESLKTRLVEKAWDLHCAGVDREILLAEAEASLKEAEASNEQLRVQLEEALPAAEELSVAKEALATVEEAKVGLEAQVEELKRATGKSEKELRHLNETNTNLRQQLLELQSQLKKEEDTRKLMESARDSLLKELQQRDAENHLLQESLDSMRRGCDDFVANNRKVQSLEAIVKELEQERKRFYERSVQETKAKEEIEAQLGLVEKENAELRLRLAAQSDEPTYEKPTLPPRSETANSLGAVNEANRAETLTVGKQPPAIPSRSTLQRSKPLTLQRNSPTTELLLPKSKAKKK